MITRQATRSRSWGGGWSRRRGAGRSPPSTGCAPTGHRVCPRARVRACVCVRARSCVRVCVRACIREAALAEARQALASAWLCANRLFCVCARAHAHKVPAQHWQCLAGTPSWPSWNARAHKVPAQPWQCAIRWSSHSAGCARRPVGAVSHRLAIWAAPVPMLPAAGGGSTSIASWVRAAGGPTRHPPPGPPRWGRCPTARR